MDSARRLTDRYAEVLPPDSIRKYRDVILGLNLADDYGCADCWGGRAIRQSEIAQWADYARTRFPGLALGVRVEPQWVASYPALGPEIDYAWAQYHTRKGEPKAYYAAAAATAQKLGLEVVMGVNVEHCYGPNTDACSPADLQRFGTLAVTHPGELRVHQLEVRAGAVGGSGGAGGVGRAVRGGAGAGGSGVREGELRPECRL